MESIKKIKALGLMSGSSLDGVSASVIVTDGIDIYEELRSINLPYSDDIRLRLKSILGKKPQTQEEKDFFYNLSNDITIAHANIANKTIQYIGEEIDVIGFHGHTILHIPQDNYICQLGDGQLLANLTNTKVVNRFSNADLLAGGQGAPLSSIFYASRLKDVKKPAAFINIGGYNTSKSNLADRFSESIRSRGPQVVIGK